MPRYNLSCKRTTVSLLLLAIRLVDSFSYVSRGLLTSFTSISAPPLHVMMSLDSEATHRIDSRGKINTKYLLDRPDELNKQTKAILLGESPRVTENAVPVLYALAKSGEPEKAQAVLDRLRHNPSSGLTSKHYTIVVDAWGLKRQIHKAEAVYSMLLEDWEATSRSDDASALAPNRVIWNVLLNANMRHGNLDRARHWLAQIEENDQATRADYFPMLLAYAHHGDAHTAEQLIKYMVDRCKKEVGSECDCAPDMRCYEALLLAHAKSQHNRAGQRALEIFTVLTKEKKVSPVGLAATIMACSREMGYRDAREMVELTYWNSQSGNYSHHEPWVSNHYGIDWSKINLQILNIYNFDVRSDPSCAMKAQELVEIMEAEGEATTRAYNIALACWKKANVQESVPKSLEILKRMESRCLCDAVSYATVTDTLAAKGDKASAKKASEILDSMQGDSINKLETNVIRNVILAQVKCGNLEQAESLLDVLENHCLTDPESITIPPVICYKVVMEGLGKAGREVDAIFRRMERLYEQGIEGARPDRDCYVFLIMSWTMSHRRNSPQKAEEALRRMTDEYTNGNPKVMPEASLVGWVIRAWQRSGDRDAGEHAEALLYWMLSLHQDGKVDSFRPNEIVFSSTISAWSRSRYLGKSIRARKILDDMVDLHKAGVLSTPPNVHCYTAVINACAHCEKDELEVQRALQIALKTFKEIMTSEHASPNSITFASMITALRWLMPESDERDSAVEKVFQLAAKHGHVNFLVVRNTINALGTEKANAFFPSQMKEGTTHAQLVETFPSEWRRKVASEKIEQSL